MLATLLLFGVFTLSAASLTVVGAQIYGRISAASQQSNDLRASCSYLTNKVRSCGGEMSIQPGPGEGDMLILSEEIGGEAYYTRIYLNNGFLTESFLPASIPFDPDNGEELVEAASFNAIEEAGLFQFSVETSEGTARSFSVRSH